MKHQDELKVHAIKLVLDPPKDFPGLDANHDVVTLHAESTSEDALEWIRCALSAHILTELNADPLSED